MNDGISEFQTYTLSDGSCSMLSWKILKSKASIAAFQSNFPQKYLTFFVSLGHCMAAF